MEHGSISGTFWSTETTNCDISYNPYTTLTHMYMNHGTYIRHSNSDEHNNNNSDRYHKDMDTQQDNIGVNNTNMP